MGAKKRVQTFMVSHLLKLLSNQSHSLHSRFTFHSQLSQINSAGQIPGLPRNVVVAGFKRLVENRLHFSSPYIEDRQVGQTGLGSFETEGGDGVEWVGSNGEMPFISQVGNVGRTQRKDFLEHPMGGGAH